MKTTIKSRVSERALLARINRAYGRTSDRNTWVMRKARGCHVGKGGMGEYAILDEATSCWVKLDAPIEIEARKLGVLKPYEVVA